MRKDINTIIKDSFIQYSAAVLQSRALVDVRDCIKPSARQIFYCMKTDNFTSDKPFQKTLKAIGSAFRMYIHGDSSVEGIIMRAGQPFAYRYPLVEVEGSYGTLLSSSSWAAPRYTASRLSPLAEYLFKDINKNAIDEWRDNYDNTEQYPAVLPSKGFYNIVNGSFGLGVGTSCSVPQYNLKELNNALITLLNNPDASFEDIYVAPDFATGAIILNSEEVKESHRMGRGHACKIRSVMHYDAKDNCLVVTEIPYMVYTETICKELEEIVNSEENNNIEKFNDLTGVSPCIKIYLKPNSNVEEVTKFLYKNTSLQSFYGVNFTMLDNGRFPKVFTWKEILTSHLEHEKEVYRRCFEFDLQKLEARKHILDGYIIVLADIEEVVKLIKSSESVAAAKASLIEKYLLDDIQATAVLKLALSRLAHMEVEKIEKELAEILTEIKRINTILSTPSLLNKEIENGLREVAERFGDGRRTQLLNIEGEKEETVELKSIKVVLTSENNIYTVEESSIVETPIINLKLPKNESIKLTCNANTRGRLALFASDGDYTSIQLSKAQKNLDTDKNIVAISLVPQQATHIAFVTKLGNLKVSEIEEYNFKSSPWKKGVSLKAGDEVVNVIFFNKEQNLCVLNADNYLNKLKFDNLTISKRVTQGVKCGKGEIITCFACTEIDKVSLLSKDRKISTFNIAEIPFTSRLSKGTKVYSLPILNIINSTNNIVITTKSRLYNINASLLEPEEVLSRGKDISSFSVAENPISVF